MDSRTIRTILERLILNILLGRRLLKNPILQADVSPYKYVCARTDPRSLPAHVAHRAGGGLGRHAAHPVRDDRRGVGHFSVKAGHALTCPLDIGRNRVSW